MHYDSARGIRQGKYHAACQVEALREPTRPATLAYELKSVAASFEHGKGHYSAWSRMNRNDQRAF